MNKNIPVIGYMISPANYANWYRDTLYYGHDGALDEFTYDWHTPEQNDIVVFGDDSILLSKENRFDNVKHKVAWLMESPALFKESPYHADILKYVLENLDQFSVVATCDDSLIEKHPDKFKYVPFGDTQILKHETKIYDKTELCSMTSGVMRWQGHKMRIKVFDEFQDSNNINFMGRGFNAPFSPQLIGFKDFMYHVTVSNSKVNRYFCSNLLDPIACGTIPIHCGFSRIDEFFNMDGIITFDTINELKDIMDKIGPDDYYARMDAMKENMELLEQYRTSDNALWIYALKDLIK